MSWFKLFPWLLLISILVFLSFQLGLSQSPVYVYSADFSQDQGQMNWYYLYDSLSGYREMHYKSEGFWQGDEDIMRLRKGVFHPGEGADALLAWIAPIDGLWRLSGKITDANDKCGDGVIVSVESGGEVLWDGIVENGRVTSLDYNLKINLGVGDEIIFRVSKGLNARCDATQWNPRITLIE